MAAASLPKRSEVAVEETWDVESMFSGGEWEAAAEQLQQQIEQLRRYRGRLSESGAVVAAYFAAWDELWRLADRVYYYAVLRRDVDSGDAAAAAQSGRATQLRSLAEGCALHTAELAALPRELLQRWSDEHSELAFLPALHDQLTASQQHSAARNADALRLLKLQQPAVTVYRAWRAELVCAPVLDSQGRLHHIASIDGDAESLRSSADRQLRRGYFEATADAAAARRATAAAIYAAHLKAELCTARLSYGDDADVYACTMRRRRIPVALMDCVVTAWQAHWPLWQRYFGLRRRLMRVDRLHWYDLTGPWPGPTAASVPYAQAVDWLCQALAPLGRCYVDTLRRGCTSERWVDRCRNAGKRGGCYSLSGDGMPPWLLLSYAGTVANVFELAHELGHSMHYLHTRAAQPRVFHSAGPLIDEVPSHVHQNLLLLHLLDDPAVDSALRLGLLQQALNVYYCYFFLVPLLCAFERDAHRLAATSAALTADRLGQLLLDRLRPAVGCHVHLDEPRLAVDWIRYRSLFYSFSSFTYTTGIICADAIVARIRADPAATVPAYLRLLASGGRLDAVDSLRLVGVDLLAPDIFDNAYRPVVALLDQLEHLLQEQQYVQQCNDGLQ